MNACEEFAALLDPYVDGELSPEEAARVRAHLENCGGCRSYVDAALAIRAAFPSAEDTAVPDGFADGVLAAIRSAPRAEAKPARKAPWVKLLVPLAACCALMLLVQRVPWRSAPTGNSTAAVSESAQMDAAPAEGGSLQPYLASPAPSDMGGGAPETAMDRAEEDTVLQPTADPEPRTFYTTTDEPGAPPTGEETEAAAKSVPGTGLAALMAPEDAGAGGDSALEESGPQDADAWVEYGNVVFAATVYLTPEYVGGALDGYEGRPFSNANYPEKGVIGTGYALEQADFERILTELDYPLGPMLNQDRTTELNCIVVTEDAPDNG